MARNSNSNRRRTRSGNLLTACLESAENTIFRDWAVFWNNQQNTKTGNVRIRVKDQVFHLHSHFLSFWSDYFDNLPNGDTNEVINLNCKKCYFNIIINFLYNGVLNLTGDNVKDILFLADKFHIDSITQACCKFIIIHLPEMEDVVEILELLCRRDSQWMVNTRTHIIQRWNKIHNMNVLRTIFSSHVPSIESMLDILEFLCSTNRNQWMTEIQTQIIRKSTLIYLSDVLQAVSINVLKMIISDVVVKREKDVIEICHRWVNADIENRLDHIPELANCISGENENFHDFHLRYKMPLDAADIGRIFHELLESYVNKKIKVDFLYYAGLVNKSTDPNVEQMRENHLIPCTIEELYVKHWRHRMKILRYNAQNDNITIKVRNAEYSLELWVLSLSSKYFSTVTPTENVIELDLSKEDFESVLNFMYGKVLRITTSNLYSIIRASRYLKITSCEKLLHEYMMKNLPNLTDIFPLLNICSDQHDQKYNLVKNHILRYFSNLDRNFITCLRVECLKIIVSSRILRVSKEERLKICEDWVMHDILNRHVYVPELMQAMNSYFNDTHIQMISQFNIRLKDHLRSQLFGNAENEDEDTNDIRIDTFGIPFTIKLPLLEPCPRKYVISTNEKYTRNTNQKKKLQFGLPFYIHLPLMSCRSI